MRYRTSRLGGCLMGVGRVCRLGLGLERLPVPPLGLPQCMRGQVAGRLLVEAVVFAVAELGILPFSSLPKQVHVPIFECWPRIFVVI